mmetsp:Transcript_13512/g.15473  ORF Transcript_13512/g.15473 Transcript_13512/m.15473 type:complete len:216 (-) Transcript_13512:169-816(-)
MSGTLYVLASCPYCWRVWVTATAAGCKFENKFLTLEEIRGEEYRKINPSQKVPALQTKDGFIFESNAILRYIAREYPTAGLYGSNPMEEALVDQWLDWGADFGPAMRGLFAPVLGMEVFDKDAQKSAMEVFSKRFKFLDGHFKNNKYFVGDHITIADFALGTALRIPFQFSFEEGFRKAYPNVLRWFDEVSNHEAVQKCLGRVRYCVKAFPTKKA